ncbi:MAG TPA: hypothetical protein VD789_02680 [Thermomicrobiales bacterium]|nr:hypothetical protein [Thermomicrobiales bacterium]
MATTSEAVATAPSTGQRPRDRRVTIFRIAAGLVSIGLLFGGMIIFFMLSPWILIGPEPEGYTAEIHRWHHADVGALFGFLVAGSLLAAIPDPRRRPVLVQAAIVALGSMLAVTLVDEISPGGIAIPFIVLTLIIASYPVPRALITIRQGASISVPLLVLAVATAVPLLRNAWDNLQLQADDHSQHAAENHWSGSAAVAIALVLIALIVASRRPGWQVLAGLLGAAYVYLGVAALTIPDHDGSWGVGGGLLALVAGGAYLATAQTERRHVSRSGASMGIADERA